MTASREPCAPAGERLLEGNGAGLVRERALARKLQRRRGLSHTGRPAQADDRRRTLRADQPAPQPIHLSSVHIMLKVRRTRLNDFLHHDDFATLTVAKQSA